MAPPDSSTTDRFQWRDVRTEYRDVLATPHGEELRWLVNRESVQDTATGALIVGFCVSLTVTFWLAVALLPLASVAVHVTTVKPFGKIAGALLLTLEPGQLSLNVGLPSTTPLAEH